MDSKLFSKPLGLQAIQITDEFWGREQELVRKEVIPYQWEALNDRVPDAAPSYCMRNFKVAGELLRKKHTQKDFVEPVYSFRGFNALPEEGKEPEPDKFYGFVFQDSDFSKWIEAVGYSLINCPDEELERTADEAIDIVCNAQADNGYLDTYYIINGMDRIFTNLRDHHELYCFGHLLEGAISYYEATGKDRLLRAAMRYGDFIASYFGYEEGKCKGYPGHEIAEMALARLYELTGEEKYLNLSCFFLDMRGQSPNYFDVEEEARNAYEGRPYHKPSPDSKDYYHQAHMPVRDMTEAVGHAVRAVYLYSGMADVARLKQDESLLKACREIWKDIVQKKMYITGGIGSSHLGEAFTFAYDLPNDTAYSETCAAIGLAFFARRMLQIEAKNQYGDVMEQALYNTVLAGMALDGKSFFYVNPLDVRPEACKKDERKYHVKPIRQKWFGCACCPPNIARIVSSLGAYAYTESEDVLYTHLYLGSLVSKQFGEKTLDIQVNTDYPWDGHIEFNLHVDSPVRGTLAFRIPGWVKEAKVEICSTHTNHKSKKFHLTPQGLSEDMANDSEFVRMENGYLYLTDDWQDEDCICLDFPLEVRIMRSNSAVWENTNRVAFLRGPVCYCMEEADNGSELQLVSVDSSRLSKIAVENDMEFGHRTISLHVPGLRMEEDSREDSLYTEYVKSREKTVDIKLIPYYAWGNRKEGEMKVWIPIK